jgi:cell division protein ZipA
MIEFGPREMTVALGALVFLAVMLHVMRRIRNARYDNIQMPAQKPHTLSQKYTEEVDRVSSDFPSGGARVVRYRDDGSLNVIKHKAKKIDGFNESDFIVDSRAPEQPNLDLQKPAVAHDDRRSAGNLSADKKTAVPSIVVLHIVAKKGSTFQGESLLDAFLSQDLRYGSKKIFHFHAEQGGSGPIIFSLVNSVKPGTFDLDEMPCMTTPSISLFFAMDDLKSPMAGLDALLSSAKNLAIELNGELKDESRSAFTRQTEEHYRQRIADYSRTQISGI